MTKVSCKGCQHLILASTAQKYQGYSRQCLAKKEKSYKKTNLEISDRPTIPTLEDIRFHLGKTTVHFPKIYYFKEFVRVWSLAGNSELAEYYYKQYLQRMEVKIQELNSELGLDKNNFIVNQPLTA